MKMMMMLKDIFIFKEYHVVRCECNKLPVHPKCKVVFKQQFSVRLKSINFNIFKSFALLIFDFELNEEGGGGDGRPRGIGTSHPWEVLWHGEWVCVRGTRPTLGFLQFLNFLHSKFERIQKASCLGRKKREGKVKREKIGKQEKKQEERREDWKLQRFLSNFNSLLPKYFPILTHLQSLQKSLRDLVHRSSLDQTLLDQNPFKFGKYSFLLKFKF